MKTLIWILALIAYYPGVFLGMILLRDYVSLQILPI